MENVSSSSTWKWAGVNYTKYAPIYLKLDLTIKITYNLSFLTYK